jgi:hypothetical protein
VVRNCKDFAVFVAYWQIWRSRAILILLYNLISVQMQTMGAKVALKASDGETSAGPESVAFRLLTVEDQLRRLVELQNSYGSKGIYLKSTSASRDVESSVVVPERELLSTSMSVSLMSEQNTELKSNFDGFQNAQCNYLIENNQANMACFHKLQDLPIDLPEFGDELDVPSLEDLILDVGAAEAEMFARQQLSHIEVSKQALNGTRPLGLGPVQSLPLGCSQNCSMEHTRSKSIGHLIKTEILGKRGVDELNLSDIVKGQRGQHSRRNLDAPVEENVSSLENIASSSAVLKRSLADKKVRVAPSVDDLVLLNKLEVCQTPFAAYSCVPLSADAIANANANANTDVSAVIPNPEASQKAAAVASNSRRAKISGANSLPNRHWLSPSIAMSTARASKPPDDKVLKWLLDGETITR